MSLMSTKFLDRRLKFVVVIRTQLEVNNKKTKIGLVLYKKDKEVYRLLKPNIESVVFYNVSKNSDNISNFVTSKKVNNIKVGL